MLQTHACRRLRRRRARRFQPALSLRRLMMLFSRVRQRHDDAPCRHRHARQADRLMLLMSRAARRHDAIFTRRDARAMVSECRCADTFFSRLPRPERPRKMRDRRCADAFSMRHDALPFIRDAAFSPLFCLPPTPTPPTSPSLRIFSPQPLFDNERASCAPLTRYVIYLPAEYRHSVTACSQRQPSHCDNTV